MLGWSDTELRFNRQSNPEVPFMIKALCESRGLFFSLIEEFALSEYLPRLEKTAGVTDRIEIKF
mgnify:CR=1 FL=1